MMDNSTHGANGAAAAAATAAARTTACDKITQRNATSCPFLRLPAELRNHIYQAAFQGATSTIKERWKEDSQFEEDHHQAACSLVFTCRQIRHEALPALYALSIFDISTPDGTCERNVKILDSFSFKHIQCLEVGHNDAWEMNMQMAYSFQSMAGSDRWSHGRWVLKFEALKHVHVDMCHVGPDSGKFYLHTVQNLRASLGEKGIELYWHYTRRG
ncbi:hypothetical protein CC86DRAFT_11628 [Ophiobolus disseminans]|uniref:2EXR domain-containing protein n=1 Tax=Ophiobolus disseminans TaxID=1469910 RepID=A0A6A7AK11_9PLEO|nr:hypothetical protein CC86DRAFT_11628 [Ophiobolus disseminans]